MTAPQVTVLGVSLALILIIAAVFLLRRKQQGPADRYRRSARQIQLSTYRQTKPRPTRQPDPPQSSGVSGFGGF